MPGHTITGNTLTAGYTVTANGALSLYVYGIAGGHTAAFGVLDTKGPATIVLDSEGRLVANPNSGVGASLAPGGHVTVSSSENTITAGTGVYISGGLGTVVNSGSIIASSTAANAFGIVLAGGGTATNHAGGIVSGVYGGVGIRTTKATVVNMGSINGGTDGVALAAGGYVTNASIATIAGYNAVETGEGLGTIRNAGKILGGTDGVGYGVGEIDGGSVTNSASGTISGETGVTISGGAGTVVTGGTIRGATTAIILAAGYSNLVEVRPGAVFIGTVNGGNTLSATGSISTLELVSGTLAGTATGFGSQYVNFYAVTVGSGATWTLAAGTAAGMGTLVAGATLTDSGTLTNAGVIDGYVNLAPGAVLTNAAGASITNNGNATVEGQAGGAATVVNDGAITGVGTDTVLLSDGGAVTNQGSGVISASTYGIVTSGVAASITNQSGGTITADQIGIKLTADGSVGNTGLIQSFGHYGILSDAAGTITNYGSGVITGVLFGISAEGGSITNDNGGTISGSDVDGLAFFAPGSGTASGTVTNAGVILSANNGMSFAVAGTVTNQSGGTISGAHYAVLFAAGVTNLLVVDPGAVFTGTVDGANTIGSTGTSISTLELGSGTSAGTLTGFGTEYLNFGGIGVDAHASWTLAAGTTAGMGTVASGVTLTDSGTLTNAGVIDSDLTLGAGAVLSNLTNASIASGLSAAVYGVAAGASTVVNAGGITGTANYGLEFLQGGTVTNAGSGVIHGKYGGIKVLGGAASVTNQSGATISAKNEGVYVASGFAANVANYGVISGIDSSGVFLRGGGTAINGGMITGEVYIGGASGTVTNQSGGTIGGVIAGIQLAAGGSVINMGITTGSTSTGPGLITGSQEGVSISGNGEVINEHGGTISAKGGALYLGYGVLITGGVGSVTNAGAILAGTGGAANYGDGVSFAGGGTVINQAGGTISATTNGVLVTGGAATVTNAAIITGGTDAVQFAAKYTNRLIVDPGAVFSGTIDGGNAIGATSISTLELASGASSGTLAAPIVDFGIITVDAKAAWTLAGGTTAGIGTIGSGVTMTDNGALANDGMIQSGVTLGSGASLTNAKGAAISNSSQGAVYSGSAVGVTVVNAGLLSAPQVPPNSGVLISYQYAVALGSGTVTNASTGTITGGIGVELTDADATVTNSGHILGSAGGIGGVPLNFPAGVLLRAGGTVANLAGLISGKYGVVVKGGGTITNAATIDGGVDAVQFAAGYTNRLIADPGAVFTRTVDGGNTIGSTGTSISTLELASGATAGTLTGIGASYVDFGIVTIDANASWTLASTAAGGAGTVASGVTLTDNGTLTNAGLIDYAVTLGPHAVLTNAQGGTIADGSQLGAVYGVTKGGVGTVVNDGRITASSGAGLFLRDSGSVTNQGSGAISGAADGIVSNGGDVTNLGGGTISGAGFGGVYLSSNTGTVTNAGAILAPAGIGVKLGDGGAVTNQAGGMISGTTNGVVVADAAGTVTNAATIIGGTDAVQFAGNYTNRLIVDPGAVFTGTVDGGNSIATGSISTLELASGASAGTLSGLGSKYINFARIQVDQGAAWGLSGSTSIRAGADVADQGALLLSGTSVAGGGAVTVDSTGLAASFTVAQDGAWTGASPFVVGGAGIGGLAIESAGDVGASSAEIGVTAGSSGSITVTGAQSRLNDAGTLVAGDAGVGQLTIDDGGTVTAGGGLSIASAAPASGSSVDLSGSGSNLQVTGLLDVGVDGSGGLSINDGASVTAGTLDAGNIISAVANISITGANFTVTGNATVADDGSGVMSVLGGATFSTTNLTIGAQGDASGALVVSGEGSIVNISGELNVGTADGTGDLTIGPGATVDASVVSAQGAEVLESGDLDPTVNLINQGQTAGGSGTIAAGDIVDEGVIQAGGSKPSQKLLVVAGTIVGGGPWTINGTAQAQANGDVGVLQINAGGTLELTGPVSNAGSTTFTDDVTPQSTYTVNNSVVDVNFEDATGALKLDDIGGFAGTIVAFRKGDSFVITGGTLSNLGVTGGNTLTVSDSGDGGTDDIIFGSGISASGFNIVNNNTIQVACFAAGTRIATRMGLVAVERLGAGDRIMTNDGTYEPVVWVGQRTVNCERHPSPATVWPVRVRAGAFGENVPVRDLYLSPDHAVFVNGVLVPVKLLINGTTITSVKRSMITYHHLELPRHAVILAEGLTVESYLDLGGRANFDGGETIRLFPDFAACFTSDAALVWETRGAAPLVMAGEALEQARRLVASRAARQPCRYGGHQTIRSRTEH